MRGPGDAVRVAMTKWGPTPHWSYTATYLGADDHGDWVGLPTGTPLTRPGRSLVSEAEQVVLAPRAEAGGAGWWLATFHATGHHVATYVDMATPPVWDGSVLSAVDLDLDVVQTEDGRVYVDDEDEFAEHSVSLGYPAEIAAGARASCTWVEGAVRAGRAPYDGTHLRWLAVLADLSRAG